jgi:Na+/melibiose symporter-like transporter
MSTAGLVALFILPIITHGKIVAGRASTMPLLCTILLIAFAIGVFLTTALTPERTRYAAARTHFAPADYWRALARPNLLFLILVDFVLSTGFGVTAPILLYFFHDAKGFTDADVSIMLTMRVCLGIIAPPLWATLARRVGKRVALQIACGAYAIAQTVVIAMPGVPHTHVFADLLPTMIAVTVAGCAASAHNLLMRAMAIDIVDEVKLSEKKDYAGLILSMVTTTTKIGGTVSVAIAFPILQLVGYSGRPGAVNSPSAIFGLEMCYVLIPIGLVALGTLVLFGYKLDRQRHAEIESALKQEDHLEPLWVPPMAPELATVDPVIEV